MKKMIHLLTAILIIVFCATAPVQAESLERKNSVALKAGYHTYEGSDFMDFWGVDKKDYDGFVGEISYERKFSKYLAIEAAGGFFSSTKSYSNTLLASDNLDTKFTNYYISPSIKLYLPLSNFNFYIGAGPDYYYSVVKLEYVTPGGINYSDSKRYNSFGYHGLAGIEYLFYRKPGEDNFYDAPVGILIEYKYSKVTIGDADENAIDYLNANLGTGYPKHDLEAGGHTFLAGLRWHF